MLGEIYNSKNSGKFKIIAKVNKPQYYLIKFLDTGYEGTFRKDAIKNGEVLDKYRKTRCGVACIGNVKTKGENRKSYNVWSNMVDRCYNTKNPHYKSYGGNGVTVCSDWLVFENFLKDIENIQGWDILKFEKGLLELDKDYKQKNVECKIYSVETCSWLSKKVNNFYQPSQQRKFKATSPEGINYESINISDFARIHNLNRRGISGVLNGRNKTHLGWKFKYC